MILSSATFVVYALFLEFSGAQYSLLLGGVAAVLEFIPVVGPLSAAVIIVMVEGFTGYSHVILLLVFFVVYRMFQDYVLSLPDRAAAWNSTRCLCCLVFSPVSRSEAYPGCSSRSPCSPFCAFSMCDSSADVPPAAGMKLLAIAVVAIPAFAHVVSMSTGDAALNGARLDYELRMPMYEVAHIQNAEPALFGAIHFYGGGDEAQLVSHPPARKMRDSWFARACTCSHARSASSACAAQFPFCYGCPIMCISSAP